MPRFDRTGPEGRGMRTGRKQGECVRNSSNKNISGDPQRKSNKLLLTVGLALVSGIGLLLFLKKR